MAYIVPRSLEESGCVQCIRCSLLLQMSHAAWSVCQPHGSDLQKWLNRSRWHSRDDTCGSKEPSIRWGGQDQTNLFIAVRGDKSALQLSDKLLVALLICYYCWYYIYQFSYCLLHQVRQVTKKWEAANPFCYLMFNYLINIIKAPKEADN